jgi:hypothetical protein
LPERCAPASSSLVEKIAEHNGADFGAFAKVRKEKTIWPRESQDDIAICGFSQTTSEFPPQNFAMLALHSSAKSKRGAVPDSPWQGSSIPLSRFAIREPARVLINWAVAP